MGVKGEMAENSMTDKKPTHERQGTTVICAASILCFVLGSIHAFSIFLEPLEARFSASRSQVSLIYSLALIMLTLAVLLGHRLFSRISTTTLVLGICSMAAIGALIAAFAPSLVGVWTGYSVLFGAANGLGYAFGLQSAAMASPGREGLAMGIVTAAYALGATEPAWLYRREIGSNLKQLYHGRSGFHRMPPRLLLV